MSELRAVENGGWLSRLTGWVVGGREQAAPGKAIRDADRVAEGREDEGPRRTLMDVVGSAWSGARAMVDSTYANALAAEEHSRWLEAEERAARSSGLGRDATTSGPVVRAGRSAFVEPLDPDIVAKHASAWMAFSLHVQKSVADGVIAKTEQAVVLAAGSAALAERLALDAGGSDQDIARYQAKISERLAAMLGMTPERLRESRQQSGTGNGDINIGALDLDHRSVKWSIRSAEWYFNNSGGSHDVSGAVSLLDGMVHAGNAALETLENETPTGKLSHISEMGGVNGTSGLKVEAIANFVARNVTPGAVLNAQTAFHTLVERQREPERSRLTPREQGMVVMAVKGFADQVVQSGGLSAFEARGGMAHILRDGVQRHGEAAAIASLDRSRAQVEAVLAALQSLTPGQFREGFLGSFDGRGGDARAKSLSDGQSGSFAAMGDEQVARIRNAMITALEARRDFKPQVERLDNAKDRFQAAHDFVQAARDLLAPAQTPQAQDHDEWGRDWSHVGIDTALRTIPVEPDHVLTARQPMAGEELAGESLTGDHAVALDVTLDALRDSLWRIAGQTPTQPKSGFDAIWSDPVERDGMLSGGVAWDALEAVQRRLNVERAPVYVEGDTVSQESLSPATALQVFRMARAAETLSAQFPAPVETEVGRLAVALNDMLSQRGATVAAETERKALAVGEIKTAMLDIERRYAGLAKPVQPDGKRLPDLLFSASDRGRVVEALDKIAAYTPSASLPSTPPTSPPGAGQAVGAVAKDGASVRPALGRDLESAVVAATLNLVKADLAESLRRDLAGRDERLLSNLVDGPRGEPVSAVISRMRGGLAYIGEASADRALADIDNRYRATREIANAITVLNDAAGRDIGKPKALAEFLARIAESPALLADTSMEKPVAHMHQLYGDMRRWAESGNAPEESRRAATTQLRVMEANFRSLGVDLSGAYRQRLDQDVRRQAADDLVARLHDVTRNAKPKPELLGELIEHIRGQAINPSARPIRPEWVALLNLAEKPPRGAGEPAQPVSECLRALGIDRNAVVRADEPSIARERVHTQTLNRPTH